MNTGEKMATEEFVSILLLWHKEGKSRFHPGCIQNWRAVLLLAACRMPSPAGG
jgi:hypothetical protein